MDFIPENLLAYCEKHTSPENELLHELNRQTHLRISSPRMLSGHLQGRFLAFIAHMFQPSTILEIGTYTGYSALCLAEGLKKGGRLISIDPNEETMEFARDFINKSPYAHSITLITGQAEKEIPRIQDNIDLVFIDADKKNYTLYYDLVFEKVVTGGIIIADNVLWSGKVLDTRPDKDTQAIIEFNQKIRNDSRVNTIMLPIRDGLTLIRKL